MKFEVDRTLFPFESKFKELPNDVNIHYVDEGEGPVLLMFHGNPAWSFLYRKMILNLKNAFRCIAFDLPGFGLSEAPEDYDFLPATHSMVAESFIKALDLNDIIFICQDWGGPISLGWAGRNPNKIKGIIIGNTWAWPVNNNFGFQLFSGFMGGLFGRTMANSFNGVAKFFMNFGFVNKLSKEEKAMYLAPFANKVNRKQTALFPKAITSETEYLKEVEIGLQKLKDVPVLFCWGTEDFAFGEPERNRFKEIFSNTETVLLNASHFWQDDQADEASQAILNWFSKI